MQVIYSLLIVIVVFSGCQGMPKPSNETADEPPVSELHDFHLDVKKNGDVILQKQYEHFDKETNTTKKVATQENITQNKGYERVPVFDKGYKKQLSLKGKKQRKYSVKGGKVKVSVESIPMNEFIDLVFGSLLKLNYTLSEDVKKMTNPVTLNMTEPQKASQFFEVVKKILSLNGVKVKDENGILFLSRLNQKNSLITQDVYIGYGRLLPDILNEDKKIILFVPYFYVDPKYTLKIVRESGIKKVYFSKMFGNMQMLMGTKSDIVKTLQIINMIDRPYNKGKIPYLIYFDNINANIFFKNMLNILKINGIRISKKFLMVV